MSIQSVKEVPRKRRRVYKLDRLIERYWFFGRKTNATDADKQAFERAQQDLANYVAANRDRIVWLPR